MDINTLWLEVRAFIRFTTDSGSINLLFGGSFLWKGSQFGGTLCNYGFHVGVTFRGIFATSALIGFFTFLRLYRIFDDLRETKAYNQEYELWLLTTQAKQYNILPGLLLTSKSHHSSSSFRQSRRRTVDLPEFRIVYMNCWEDTRPKIVCHQPWQC